MPRIILTKHIFILLTVFLFLISSVSAAADFTNDFADYLAKTTQDRSRHHTDGDILSEFYQDRNYQPVWFDSNNRALMNIDRMETALQNSAYDNGLDPRKYSLEAALSALENGADQDNMNFKREAELTNTVLDYLHDLRHGIINPENYDSMIFRPTKESRIDIFLAEIMDTRQPEQILARAEPQQPDYQGLKKHLGDYREIRDQNRWNLIDTAADPIIYPGEYHDIIPELRKRLSGYNYDGVLPPGTWLDQGRIANPEAVHERAAARRSRSSDLQNGNRLYDDDLLKQVVEYQYFHGQKTDGIIGPQTLAALNIPVEDRIDQIKLALERWRWFPEEMGERHILVNIAGFYTTAIENGQEVFTMPIIVGEVAHQTPVFSSVIHNIRMHPDWTVPASIARRYLIKKIQNNPQLIDRLGYQLQHTSNGRRVPWHDINISNLHNIDLSKYRFRQKPGVNNALGLVRFSIKNNYSIFMHGTPAMSLFDEDSRTFSSGCIRVEEPLVMAKFLLAKNDLTEKEIEELYHLEPHEQTQTKVIELAQEVPVYLTYTTAWVDRQGHLHFADDVYGRDEKLMRAFSRL